jgi:hypothetical protein
MVDYWLAKLKLKSVDLDHTLSLLRVLRNLRLVVLLDYIVPFELHFYDSDRDVL